MSENGGDSILTGSMKRLDGSDQDLSEFEGDVVLVVNTASKCGLTPQYEGLQRLYDEKNDAGFTVLGFPANDFLEQEPGGEDEIAEFCQVNYGVSFPMFAKTSVKGDDANPLFATLTELSEEPEWNFAKYLIGRDGKLVSKFPAQTVPEDPEVVAAIDAAL